MKNIRESTKNAIENKYNVRNDTNNVISNNEINDTNNLKYEECAIRYKQCEKVYE